MHKNKKKLNSALFCLFLYALITVSIDCKIYGCQQYTSDLKILLKDAHNTQNRLITFLTTLTAKYHNSVVIDPGIKQMPTINQLLEMRCNNDASKITDYARATIGVEDLYQVYCCLEDIKASNLQVVSVRDNFANPYPNKYRDLNLVFKDSINNHFGEIQINTLALLAFKKEKGYELFDNVRKINFKAHQENRTLSNEEIQTINCFTQQHLIGNNKAFEDSMKKDNRMLRVGIYGILINKNNEVLMVQEKSGAKLIYNFPGGGVKSNEGFAETLIRECKEEILVDVSVEDFRYASKNLYIHEDFANFSMFNLYFTIKVQDPLLIKNGFWFPINNLPLHKMLPIDQEFAFFFQSTVNDSSKKTNAIK